MLGVIAAGASTTQADSVLQLTVGADPAESITTQLGATGTAPGTSDAVFITIKAAGGAPCAANYNADNGNTIIDGNNVSQGAYSTSTNWQPTAAGSYLLCGWLEDVNNSRAVLDAQSLAVAVRQPHLSISLTIPAQVQTNQIFQVSTTTQAETQRTLFEYELPNTGDGCPANAAAANDTSEVKPIYEDDNLDGGPATQTQNEQFPAGSYLFCAYFEYPQSSSTPEATASATLTVVPPPPPCVVPKVKPEAPLASVEARVTAAHCAVGAVTDAASRSVPKGEVISFSPTSGKKLASGAAVGVLVSTGPPCIVPAVTVGTRLRAAESEIRSADCSVGVVTRVHSRVVPTGRVVSLIPRAGHQLATDYPVAIDVSSGRRRKR
jgi:hypothetical protein